MHNLGRRIASVIPAGKMAILMSGPLGSGKTSLTASIVGALPGAENCEVASPSFNIFNIYPVRPEIIHCDLYRCKSMIPEELLEFFDQSGKIAIVEWSEFLKESPENFMDIKFSLCQNNRLLEVAAYGSIANEMLRRLEEIT